MTGICLTLSGEPENIDLQIEMKGKGTLKIEQIPRGLWYAICDNASIVLDEEFFDGGVLGRAVAGKSNLYEYRRLAALYDIAAGVKIFSDNSIHDFGYTSSNPERIIHCTQCDLTEAEHNQLIASNWSKVNERWQYKIK